MNLKPGVLILEGGLQFPGFLMGAPVTAKEILNNASGRDFGYGEVVFNTSMTGYQEILTDPSYYGQIICMTCPHIGNTGVNPEDMESDRVWTAGFVVHELPRFPSNWRSTSCLDSFLKERGVPGIYGVD